MGMAVSILIMLWIQYELSYDKFHQHADQIYRIISDYKGERIPVTPGPMAAQLKEEIPEITNSTRFYYTAGIMKYEDKIFRETGLMVEPDFFEVFSFPLLRGNPDTALADVSSLVITEDMARKYFGNEDPLGKTLLLDNTYPSKVTGLLKNIPANSHLKFNYLCAFKICKHWKKPDSWTQSQDYPAYVLLDKASSIELVNQKMNEIVKKHMPGWPAYYFLQPLTRIHLYSDFKFDEGHGNIQYILIFTLTALFVLIIACINFMNLSTARSANRAREIGIRKVTGAKRTQLIKQFLGEAILLTFIAAIFAVFLAELFLPMFNQLSGKQFSIHYSDPNLILGLIGIVVFSSILSGSYPALFLSNISPMKIFKGMINLGAKGTLFRKVLVTFQFSLSIIVIIGTIVVFNQLDYMKNRELGFDKENLLYFRTQRRNYPNHKILVHELLKNPDIVSITTSSCLPTSVSHFSGVDWEGKKEDEIVSFQTSIIDYSYLQTYKMKMAAGRFYSKEHSTDASEAFVVNEAAVRAMGMKVPIGKRFNSWGREGKIIGVVKDFHFKSLRDEIEPLILLPGEEVYFFTARLKRADMPKTIETIEKVWQNHCNGFPFEYGFVDDAVTRLYSDEQRLGKIFMYLAFLAVLISSLGLFGLSSFMSEQRTKEIGVRKVVGASVFSIVRLLTVNFTKWVLFANIIAWPAAYILMNKWLQGFAYRTAIGIGVFFVAGSLALIIALVTVSHQSLRAAAANPVETLRYE